MKRAARQQGYTLVEALIAVAILAAIAGALAPITHSSIGAATRIKAQASLAEDARVGRDALSELFASMILPAASQEAFAFQGARDEIRLSILTDQELGAQPITLRISDGALIYAPPSSGDRAGSDSSGPPIVLVDDAGAFRFYGAVEGEADASWRDRWEERRPPDLVELSFAGESDAPPPLSFSIATRAPLHCAFDQVSRQCRD